MIVRIQKKADPFARVPKAVLNDKRLTWKAKGILAYLLGKPNDWVVQTGDIIVHGVEGRDSVRAAFRELRKCGYAELVNTSSGREWLISDTPQQEPCPEKPSMEPCPEKPQMGFANMAKSPPTKNDKRTKNDLTKNGGGRTDTKEAEEWADRIATIFHRRLHTPWSAKEIKAFKAALPFNDDDLCMVERRYAAERLNKENTLRRDLCTFLNNYRGEVDRALAWCEKHPVRSHTLKAPISLHSEAPPPDPAAQAKFLEDFKAKFGRLPYGHTENGANGE